MPMSFPDYSSLIAAAAIHNFRTPNDKEPEESFRSVLADHVSQRDFIEGEEIRNKVGWYQFTDEQNRNMIRRKVGQPVRG